ncbi:LOW QUALITY PROTEIN: neuronal PAS domain-containing protein 4-like [Emydura macquarii macquarii]|uniref:LOW QUALITY PROTEIN: neuronal PAS domain-containing protein 4-like n=1 Tax=Emydura macquarii macquarii TaxID=1129001 RepID=UPI00352A1288
MSISPDSACCVLGKNPQQLSSSREQMARTMTIFCDHCSRPLRKEMSHSRGKSGMEPSAPKLFRSTKGASKARRDQINAELQKLRSLLPISAQDKERLSYLHTMALVCLQIRKAQLFPPGSSEPALAMMPDLELLSSLPGFIIALSADGKLAYISENVAHLLGFSVVELLAQGDSIFDLLDGSAHRAVQEKLHSAQEQLGTEIVFVSEMRTSRSFRMRYGGNRAVAVRGRFLALDGTNSSSSILTFIAFCTPIMQLSDCGDGISYDAPFQSQHTMDMKVTDVTQSVIYHLGYRRDELIGQSWYSLLHPEDVATAAAQHELLMCDAGKCNRHLVVRLLCKDLSWTWVQITVSKEYDRGRETITCTNLSLSEEEAQYIQSQNPWHGAISAAALNPRHYTREKEHKTLPRTLNPFPQETAMPNHEAPNYGPYQLPNAHQEMLPASLQPSFSTCFPAPIVGAGLPSQETGCSIIPAGQKTLPCPFSVYKSPCRQPFSSPCAISSPEVPLSPGSSPSIDACPVPVGGQSPGMSPTVLQSSEPERWAISVLAEQIHSLAESLSQYTKQMQPETPTVPLWSEQFTTDSQLGSGESWDTSGAVAFPADPCLDEDIITSILSNLLENGGLNSPITAVGSSPTLLPSDSDSRVPPFQIPMSPAVTCPNQCFFLQPLTTSVSFDSCTRESLWDGDLSETPGCTAAKSVSPGLCFSARGGSQFLGLLPHSPLALQAWLLLHLLSEVALEVGEGIQCYLSFPFHCYGVSFILRMGISGRKAMTERWKNLSF